MGAIPPLVWRGAQEYSILGLVFIDGLMCLMYSEARSTTWEDGGVVHPRMGEACVMREACISDATIKRL